MHMTLFQFLTRSKSKGILFFKSPSELLEPCNYAKGDLKLCQKLE